MVFDTGTRRLETVYEALHGKVNDVVVCRETGGSGIAYATVWVIREHVLAKELVQCFHGMPDAPGTGYLESFSSGGAFCFTFPYYQERPLEHFYSQAAYTDAQRRSIWLDCIVACMSAGLPFPVLYLLLSQGQLGLGTDGRVIFHYLADLADFDRNVGESGCAAVCAGILAGLMGEEAKKGFLGYDLLFRKMKQENYASFIELYKDVKLVTGDRDRKNWILRFRSGFGLHKDSLFKVLLAIGTGLAVLTLLMLLSQAVFGEIPFLRLFSDSFRVIGTESMR